MTTAAVKRRHRQASKLLTKVAENGPSWVEHLGQQLAQVAGDLPIPGGSPQLQHWLRALAVLVDHRLVDFQEATEERLACAEELERLRPPRDQAAQDLYELAVRQRAIVRFAAGDEVAASVFGRGTTPIAPRKLVDWTRTALPRLAELAARTGPLEDWTLRVDLAAFADDLEDHLADLESILRDVSAAEAAETGAVVRKDDAQSQFDQVFGAVSRVLEGLAALT